MQLKGPWKYQWIGAANSVSEVNLAGHIKLPDGWDNLFVQHSGQVRLSRRFGKPTNLEQEEAVFLIFEQTTGLVQIFLNEQRLDWTVDNQSTRACNITGLLQENNYIDADFDVAWKTERPAPLFNMVCLEIRPSYYQPS